MTRVIIYNHFRKNLIENLKYKIKNGITKHRRTKI